MADVIQFPRRVPDDEFHRLLNDPELIAELVTNYQWVRGAAQLMLAAITNDLDLSKRSPLFVTAVKNLRASVGEK